LVKKSHNPSTASILAPVAAPTKGRWGNEVWVNHISKQEMPALSSTIRLLENLATDDTMSLARLGQSVLHDHALTSSILKVANSAVYMSRNQITTVSRAAVVLGFTSIKNICITAKLLGSLLKSKSLSEPVYQRLLKLMAQSFHAGMLTQIMMPDDDDKTKEETFIIALLHHLGESAFWSTGGKVTEALDQQLLGIEPTDDQQVNKIASQLLGTTFDKISIGLASSWNLGDLFIRSFEDPDLRSPQLKIAALADKLSICIANPENNSKQLKALVEELSELTNTEPKVMRERIEQCTDKTESLLESYGAGELIQYLHPGAKALPDNAGEDSQPELSNEALQLQILRDLTFLTMEKCDFNVLIQTALEGIFRGIGMNRAMVLIKNGAKKILEPRFICGSHAEQLKDKFTLNINTMETVFSFALKHGESIWVDGCEDPKWTKLLSKPIRNITSPEGFFISPVMWDTHCIGLFYADRTFRHNKKTGLKESERDNLNENDFIAFTHFVQQTNLCLSIILKR
jgi:HD-like signal output (HDOD) protein